MNRNFVEDENWDLPQGPPLTAFALVTWGKAAYFSGGCVKTEEKGKGSESRP